MISPSSGTSSVRRGDAVFLANLAQLFLDDGEDALLFREDVAQVLDRLDQFLVFVVDLLALEAGQLIKAQIENLIRLVFAERVTAFGQPRFVANQDADLFDLSFRVNSKASNFTRASSRLAEPRMMRMNSSRFASAMR